MNFLKTLPISFSIVVTLALLAQLCHAQNSQQDFLDAHNAARAAVGVGDIEWDDGVAAYAEQYANKRIGDCMLQHSEGGPYGENLAGGSGGDFLTATGAVQMWVDEQVNYDYNTNTCTNNDQCLHYTQVVWADSVRLGCARVKCDSGSIFVICSYDPPGNYDGQRPF